jgi:hypothetical protein
VLAALAFALAVAGCTSSMSLGAAGTPDGGDAIVITSTGGSDAAVDRPPDVATDAPLDQNIDAQTVTCVENGVAYQVGEVIPRNGNGCLMSCVCLASGTVGYCTGVACPVDGAVDSRAIDPIVSAQITLSRSTSSPEFRVSVLNVGSANRAVIAPDGTPSALRSFPRGSPEVTLFLYDLQAVGDLSAVGDPGPISGESCGKSDSFGTQTKIVSLGVSSGDMQCLVNPTPAQTALAHDADVLLSVNQGNYLINAQRCLQTGGVPSASLCCPGTGDFPDNCAVGVCTCAPATSHTIDTCLCPNGGCYQATLGCVGRANVCTVGADQTCNDNIAINSIHGTCLTGGRCACNAGFGSTLVPASGKCS